ncbi:hypothetical protein AB0L22_31490, partial [Micromonospora haikouensis]|uniref:hypothetical protein n=1 Tax=Micromonospora haikouensis TaxID=686309 RepID=UPI00341F30C9
AVDASPPPAPGRLVWREEVDAMAPPTRTPAERTDARPAVADRASPSCAVLPAVGSCSPYGW